tara:strand:- start:9291 stop:9446 length:156 start_codon:yes stop_codon:yes gene_type:complete
MLPDQMEAEKNRKIIVSQSKTIEMLQQNVRDLQEQLNNAHVRIRELSDNKL